MKKFKYICFCLVVVSTTLFSCSNMEDSYMEFAEGGEIIYPKKVDSVALYPGKNRIKLSFVGLGHKIAKTKIFWNYENDSLEVPVTSIDGSLDVIVPDLSGGAYSFDIYTYDKSGNVSVPHTVIGNVYGKDYGKTLRVRTIQDSNIKRDTASIDWSASPSGSIFTEVTYIDEEGLDQTVQVAPTESITYLPSFVSGTSITYRTAFLPEPTSIDTFYSKAANRQIIALPSLLDKALFANLPLPGDRWHAHMGHPHWNIERAWDGITDNPGVLFHATRTGFPATITIDLGALYELTSLKLWGRTGHSDLFNKGNLKEFEIYGRADAPNMEDGSMEGWTKIMTASSEKPSGLPVGENTAADLAYAEAGEDFYFHENAEPVRYIRINVLDSWGPPADNYWYIAELNIYGFEQ